VSKTLLRTLTEWYHGTGELIRRVWTAHVHRTAGAPGRRRAGTQIRNVDYTDLKLIPIISRFFKGAAKKGLSVRVENT
jgi:hypothetical protein